MKSFFDPEAQFKMTSADRKDRFIPIEEVPDDKPDPSEALMLKEENTGEDNEVSGNGKVDVNDIGRPLSFSREKQYSEPAEHPDKYIPEDVKKVVDKVEENELKETKPNNWDIVRAGPGKHGGKPQYKDKIVTPLA
jgi:hypothetical protein